MGSDAVGILVPDESYAGQALPAGYAWCFWRDAGTRVVDDAIGFAVLDHTIPSHQRERLSCCTVSPRAPWSRTSGGAADVVGIRCHELVARQIRSFVDGGELANAVRLEANQFA